MDVCARNLGNSTFRIRETSVADMTVFSSSAVYYARRNIVIIRVVYNVVEKFEFSTPAFSLSEAKSAFVTAVKAFG